VIVAEALLEKVVGAGAQVIGRLPRAALDGVRYEPPFDSHRRGRVRRAWAHGAARRLRHRRRRHRAGAHGDRLRRRRLPAREQYGLRVVNPVPARRHLDERIRGYEGRFVKDADADLIATSTAAGACGGPRSYEHSYTRTAGAAGRRCLYIRQAVRAYLATSRIRDRLLAANEGVHWHPRAHQARALRGDTVENNVDWATVARAPVLLDASGCQVTPSLAASSLSRILDVAMYHDGLA